MPDTTPDRCPRQSLTDAWANVPPRLRWLTYHTSAAAAGWPLGWVDWATDTAAWFAADHPLHHEETPMDFIRYRVEDADGTFLDEFATNAPGFAKERIDRIRKYRPHLTVTETPDND